LDGKRNDIASTASAYADAGLGGVRIEDRRLKIEDRRADDQSSILDPPSSLIHAVWDADAMTVNPYLGRDAIEPFLESARKSGRGIFVLVRTSNPGAGQFQDLVCDGRPLFMHVAEAVGQWSRENLAKCGLGDVGAVVGATYLPELLDLRKVLEEAPLLVPGFGFQGGAVQDVAQAFRDDGLGAIINSSRGIISCFSTSDTKWERAVEKATRQTVHVLTENTNMGQLRS
jgi:orotidine-5'-phosphate decarboxylase